MKSNKKLEKKVFDFFVDVNTKKRSQKGIFKIWKKWFEDTNFPSQSRVFMDLVFHRWYPTKNQLKCIVKILNKYGQKTITDEERINHLSAFIDEYDFLLKNNLIRKNISEKRINALKNELNFYNKESSTVTTV